MEISDRKLYLGPRLRVLRRDLGINQTQMAEELGVSPSYLNHLERNQRPLTAQMLLRLANTYDIDVRDFVAGSGDTAASDLAEVFADPLVREIGIPRQEMLDVAENYPSVSEAISRLYRALLDLRRAPAMLERVEGVAVASSSPIDRMREFIAERGNHFPEIETIVEAIAGELSPEPALLQADLRQRLKAAHGISVQVMPRDVMGGNLRHYDFHRRRLMLAESLPASSRLMALAFQLCAMEMADVIRDLVVRSAAADEEYRRLLVVALTNYGAAALVMPYERFRASAEDSAYDVELLRARFGVSFEQLAHRLTSLARSGARGVPFFMVKVDVAGTISKRFAGEAFPFARFGGSCPRWNIYRTFQRPQTLMSQLIEMPDGRKYVTLSMANAAPSGSGAESATAIGLGCDVKYAPRLSKAGELPLAAQAVTTVGPACQLCEREGCPDRALPPLTRTLETSPYTRTSAPYAFRRV